MEEVDVVIAIQARLNSERLPRKIMRDVYGKRMIDRVIQTCQRAVRKQKRNVDSIRVNTSLVLAVPEGDETSLEINTHDILVITGSEKDVLSRYYRVLQLTKADYVVRITADCPVIPNHIINQHITTAISKGYDYVSNTDERCRTAPDGWDCEVISKKALKYAFDYAQSAYDREHVTPFIRRERHPGLRIGTILNYFPMPTLKLSVDTEEDLVRVTEYVKNTHECFNVAKQIYKLENVDRF